MAVADIYISDFLHSCSENRKLHCSFLYLIFIKHRIMFDHMSDCVAQLFIINAKRPLQKGDSTVLFRKA